MAVITLRSLFIAAAFSGLIFTGVQAMTNKYEATSIRHVNAQEAQTLLKKRPRIIVLDVRTGVEYKRGHIAGAVHNNYFSLKFRKRLKALKRDAAYLVHCKSGHRSSRAVKVMSREGFSEIIHMDGGYDAWRGLTTAKSAK
jgi:rhodanese-related sulfurtransferase